MAALSTVRSMGLTLTAKGDRLAVEPRDLITADARQLIQTHRAELLRELADEADLLALVARVAAHYQCPPEELAIMNRVALADPGAARECFEATALLEGIPLDHPAPAAEEARKTGGTR